MNHNNYCFFFPLQKINRTTSGTSGTSDDEASSSDEAPQPHCQIVLRCTREIAGFNGLGDVVKRLDFRSSLRDHRRFQYICALLKLLVSSNDTAGIANLSGNAQRILLQMIEEVAIHVSVSQQHFNVLRYIINSAFVFLHYNH